MRPRRPRLDEAQQRWVQDWWRALQPRSEGDASLPAELWAMGRGERARLRRCEGVDELLTQAATLVFAQRLVALDGGKGALLDDARSYERLAWVAGVLALVKNDLRDETSLAWHLGHGAGNDRPRMSELRFKAMQRSSSLEGLFIHWRRAVQLAGCTVDIARLADDLLSWQIEQDYASTRASQGVKFYWAHDYYLSTRERAASKEIEFNKETSA